jgi:hypothetical protein
MNPEQLKAALRSAGYVVASEGGGGYGSEPGDPFIPGPNTSGSGTRRWLRPAQHKRRNLPSAFINTHQT